MFELFYFLTGFECCFDEEERHRYHKLSDGLDQIKLFNGLFKAETKLEIGLFLLCLVGHQNKFDCF